MPLSSCKLLLLALILVSLPPAAAPERPTPDPPQRPKTSPLTLHAGYIFEGTVKAVRRMTPRRKTGVATVQITFHVDKAIRGVHTGQSLVIHEWAELWESGDRYRAGERMLLFLYPPSKLGLTSPVGDAAGRFKVDDEGQVVLDPGRAETLAPDAATAGRFKGKTRISTGELIRNLKLAGGE